MKMMNLSQIVDVDSFLNILTSIIILNKCIPKPKPQSISSGFSRLDSNNESILDILDNVSSEFILLLYN
ncbi:hypothetical protein DERP_006153 [Dermatophagoides pteronyssinus]|uniref:Uncharacterized protein n=1 Tax=Dermatophagoides pteronyssinus TaxID=6956 RepID=A0ABQ8JSG0_DERPT|nr:hypothetical protein DERP_006153 [Dermatophagoides pteronyssinus]